MDSGQDRVKRGALGPGERWSVRHKREVVLRILGGESLESVSREVGVELYRLEQWRDRAVAGMELALKDRTGDPLLEALDEAKRHIGELSMNNELLERQLDQLRPFAARRSRR